MRLRALAATLVLPIGLLAACNDDDAGLSVRGADTTSDTEATDSSDTTDSTETSDTTEDRTTTSEDEDEDTTTTEDDGTTTTENDDTTTTEDDSDTTLEGGPTVTYPPVVRDALISTFEGQGLTAEQADCVVGIFERRVPYEDLISGDVSGVFDELEEFASEMTDDCGVDPAQLGGISATTTG